MFKKPLDDFKVLHGLHLTSLIDRNQMQNDLIEDIRFFCKQRALIEKEYLQGLNRLSADLLNRRSFIVRSHETELDSLSNINILAIWKRIITETQYYAASRQKIVDCNLKIYKDLKPVKYNRISSSKRIFRQLKLLQNELAACIQEMCKSHKVYVEEQKHTNDARLKYYIAKDKLERKCTNIFNTMAHMQKNHDKLISYFTTCETRSTTARNEYLFQLAAINAHLQHYYTIDIPEFAFVLDGEFFEKLRDTFSSILQVESEISSMYTKKFEELLPIVRKVRRSCEWNLFKTEISIGESHVIQYSFCPCELDNVDSLCPLNNKDEQHLEQIARKLVRRMLIRESRIRAYKEEIISLSSCRTDQKVESPDDFCNNDNSSIHNTDYVLQKSDELEFAIRREEIEKCKINACLHLLHKSSIKVDSMIREAHSAAAIARKNAILECVTESNNSQSNDSINSLIFNQSISSQSKDLLFFKDNRYYDFSRATVRSEHRARSVNEIDIEKYEVLTILDNSDPCWIKVLSLGNGTKGLVPYECIMPIYSIETQIEQAPKFSPNLMETFYYQTAVNLEEGDFVRTIVDYDGSVSDELSFISGSIIRLKCNSRDNDDGWWEGDLIISHSEPGHYYLKRGMFASMLVEPLPMNLIEKWQEIWDQSQIADRKIDFLNNTNRSLVNGFSFQIQRNILTKLNKLFTHKCHRVFHKSRSKKSSIFLVKHH